MYSLRTIRKTDYYGFLGDHNDLSNGDFEEITDAYFSSNEFYRRNFESEFASFIGKGACISFASGRMALYAILSALEVCKEDEVIVTGFTCSVVVDAVLRFTDRVKFADISPITYGTCFSSIQNLISGATKVVVLQHSFGIPCMSLEQIDILRNRGVYIVEDCAITLGSSLGGRRCGDLGDASFFSTDRSKPLHTVIGGMVYTKNKGLHLAVEKIRDKCSELPDWKLNLIFKQIWFDAKWSRPSLYRYYNSLSRIRRMVSLGKTPYLNEEFSQKSNGSYGYPSKFPPFLCLLGSKKLKNYRNKVNEFLTTALIYENVLKTKTIGSIKKHFLHDNVEVVPHRYVFRHGKAFSILQDSRKFLDVDWTWYREPVQGPGIPAVQDLYKRGFCPVSEETCRCIINLPTHLDFVSTVKLSEEFLSSFSKYT